MVLQPGTRLGPYRIIARAGAGGMGEVYRAIDTRLDRVVAIKVLPSEVSTDPDRRKRLEREARAVASLNHPNICMLHDVGREGGVDFLVLEFLEGETLAQRLARGPVSVVEAVRIAAEVADALDKVHRTGIVHRDLKPGNIMLTLPRTTDGRSSQVKLLDFGLATTTLAPVVPGSDAVTATYEGTAVGVLVGTLPYMAPEQLHGRPVDARTDVFALGAVVYEMLAGRPPFQAETTAGLVARVLDGRPPPLTSLKASVPVELEDLVHRCLSIDPEDRWQDARDVAFQLRQIRVGRSAPADGPSPEFSRRVRPAWLLPALASAAVVAGLWFVSPFWLGTAGRQPQPPAAVRFTVRLPAGFQPAHTEEGETLALSPDGRVLVYAASPDGGESQLFVQRLTELDARPLSGTENARAPFFSPDGTWIGFAAGAALRKIPVDGGRAITVVDAVIKDFGGASWGDDDTIVFNPALTAGLLEVPAAGGTPTVLSTPDAARNELSHGWPQMLPGSEAVLFTVRGGATPDATRIDLLWRATGRRTQVVENAGVARMTESKQLIYSGSGMVNGPLWVAPFDAAAGRVSGPPMRVVDRIVMGDIGQAHFAVSVRGDLVYLPAAAAERSRLTWVTREGRSLLLKDNASRTAFPSLSPDGTQVAFTSVESDPPAMHIDIFDVGRGTTRRLTLDGQNHLPVWTPDGARVAYASDRDGAVNLHWQAADGSEAPELLARSDRHQDPGSWSPDGRLLAFAEINPETSWDLAVLDIETRRTRVLAGGPFDERTPMISPDGRWLAFASNASGRFEVLVQPFPEGGAKHVVSSAGGEDPLWSRDGSVLFYRRDGEVYAVPVSTGPTFGAGAPELLFSGREDGWLGFGKPNYDVDGAGDRFLMVETRSEDPDAGIVVVLDWLAGLAGPSGR